jgi:CubicO group peptidase (beta-lactamase class C family)
VVEEPGRRFLYNNFNPLLIGLALEQRLWRPLGMEGDGSWSLDSERSGFEKMESGLNGRPIDFAKFGLLFARDGVWPGRQLVPRAWVRDPALRGTHLRCRQFPAGCRSSPPWQHRCPAASDTGWRHADHGTRARQSDDDAAAEAAQARP